MKCENLKCTSIMQDNLYFISLTRVIFANFITIIGNIPSVSLSSRDNTHILHISILLRCPDKGKEENTELHNPERGESWRSVASLCQWLIKRTIRASIIISGYNDRNN